MDKLGCPIAGIRRTYYPLESLLALQLRVVALLPGLPATVEERQELSVEVAPARAVKSVPPAVYVWTRKGFVEWLMGHSRPKWMWLL